MADNKREPHPFPQEKIDIITSSSIEELMQLLDEIPVNDDKLQETLSFFVPPHYQNMVSSKKKNKKNDQKINDVVYGNETKKNYCKAIRGELKGINTNSELNQEKAIKKFINIVVLWCHYNVQLYKLELSKIVQEDDSNGRLSINFEQVIENSIKNGVAQENLRKLYKFAPISTSKKLEEKIAKAPKALDLLRKEITKNDKLNKKVEELENSNKLLRTQEKENKTIQKKLDKYSDYEELKKECEKYKDYDEIKEAKEKAEEYLKKITQEHDKKIAELRKEHQDEFTKLKDAHNETLVTQKEAFDEEIKNLQEKCTNYDQLKKEKEYIEEYCKNLEDENKTLKNKKTPSGDFKKMQKSYEEKLKSIQKESEKYSDYDDIKKENEKLKKWKLITTDNLKNLIRWDLKFKQDFKKMILSDKALCEFIIEKFPKLKQEVLMEVASRREQRNIDKELKNDTSSPILVDEYDVIVEPQEYIYSGSETPLLSNSDPDTFKSNLSQEIEGSKDYISDLCDKMNNFFVVLNNEKELRAWKHAQDEFDYKIHYVRPDFDWLSYKDWFGYFKDDGIFIPSATGISDYYKTLKNNPNIPMGIVVFRDYNRVMPSIYLETFVKNIEEKREGISLINPSIEVNKEDEIFRNIKKLDNLKFVFIKKSDKNESFDTPDFMKKYELKYTSSDEGANE